VKLSALLLGRLRSLTGAWPAVKSRHEPFSELTRARLRRSAEVIWRLYECGTIDIAEAMAMHQPRPDQGLGLPPKYTQVQNPYF
jgi:hypothetical protein